MTTGLVLIFAVLILGGVIATAGDRIGMRVGKARLSLFKLRPRQTATLITILTGSIISATTLGLLFAISEQLRTGVFELEALQEELTAAQNELIDVQQEKRRIEDALANSRQEQRQARQRLQGINASLQEAIRRQRQTEAELETITEQAEALDQEIEQLQAETQSLLNERDRREQEIAAKERQLQQLEQQRSRLEQQRIRLEQEVVRLDQEVAELERERERLAREVSALREGNLALFNNQVIVERVAEVESTAEARQGVGQLLAQANQFVLNEIAPGVFSEENVPVLELSVRDIEELIAQIRPGSEYLFRIVSGGNYLVGEPCVLSGTECVEVGVVIVPNRLIFNEGEVLASVTLSAQPSSSQSPESRPSLFAQYERLIDLTRFRARQSGALGRQITIANDQARVLRQFFLDVAQYQQERDEELTLEAIAARPIQTADAIALHLVARRGDRLMFSTETPAIEPDPTPNGPPGDRETPVESST